MCHTMHVYECRNVDEIKVFSFQIVEIHYDGEYVACFARSDGIKYIWHAVKN